MRPCPLRATLYVLATLATTFNPISLRVSGPAILSVEWFTLTRSVAPCASAVPSGSDSRLSLGGKPSGHVVWMCLLQESASCCHCDSIKGPSIDNGDTRTPSMELLDSPAFLPATTRWQCSPSKVQALGTKCWWAPTWTSDSPGGQINFSS